MNLGFRLRLHSRQFGSSTGDGAASPAVTRRRRPLEKGFPMWMMVVDSNIEVDINS